MHLLTSESVTPGHPDKLCDQISDAILDAYLTDDPNARVAVECFATAGGLIVGGEVGSAIRCDHAAIAATTLRGLGYGDYAGLPIIDRVAVQSVEISSAVLTSLEARSNAATGDALDRVGAGDQGVMFGYASDETADLMPLPVSLAHALARQLHSLGRLADFAHLGPDGKTQATIRYENGSPAGVESILVSTQHAASLSSDDVREAVLRQVIEPTLELLELPSAASVLINPSGSFTLGGPHSDAGLTGRKIIVDTYGGAARHGGGAFSGKDPSKVDRSAAYAARWAAKHVVAAGIARRCEVQVAYAIGSARPVGLHVATFGTGIVGDDRIADAVGEVFDLRPAAIVETLGLRRPIYSATAAFGHFGGDSHPWERLSQQRLADLRQAVALDM